MSKQRIIPYIYQQLIYDDKTDKTVSVASVAKLHTEEPPYFFPEISLSESSLENNELVIMKNSKDTGQFGYGIFKSENKTIYNLSAPYSELLFEYKLYGMIHNNFLSFVDKVKDFSTNKTIEVETLED